MSDLTAMLILVGLLMGNAFFVGAEFALISARRGTIEPLAKQGNRRAKATLRAMEQVSLMMAGAQLGITACSLGIGAIGEPALAHLIEPLFERLGVPEGLVHPVAFAIALAIVVYLHMVLGEMVPKNIAIAGPDRAALILGPIHLGIVTALRPLIALLNGAANAVLRLLKVEPADEVASSFTREQVATMIHESAKEGMLDEHEAGLLEGALDLADTTAADIAIPPQALRTLASTATPRMVQDIAAQTGFSRFPLVDDDGVARTYVHVKDALLPPGDPAIDQPLPTAMRHVLPTVDSDASLERVVTTLQAAGTHFGRVVEGGAVLTVVALEDALEELIGEVRDVTHHP